MRRQRAAITIVSLLLAAHIGVVITWGTAPVGAFLSDLVQLAFGGLVVYFCLKAAGRSEGLARSFWRLATTAYSFWFLAQTFSLCSDLLSRHTPLEWISNLLFCFWFVPLGMAMFLDPDHEAGSLDTLIALDFTQAVIVCVAGYLYFFYLPQSYEQPDLPHSVWAPYLVGYTFVAGAFLLRAVLTRSQAARKLFGHLGVFLALSGIVDVLYYYGPGKNLGTGAWFDILWSGLLIIPLMLAITWQQEQISEFADEAPKRDKKIHAEVFYLLYPMLVLLMSLRIAREHLALGAAVVFLSFVCSSARLLVTQHRLVLAKEALRREASRDGLTGVWNRKAILDILDRELLRCDRQNESLGVIMIDVDHFKAINDSRGHVAGDLVLRIIASEIAAVVRPYDSVGRYGGEEFFIVAPGCGMAETWDLAERIRGYVRNCSIVAGGSGVSVSLSLGIAVGRSATDSEKLLHASDTALYQAKNAGRNRVEPNVGRPSVGASFAPAAQSKFWL